MASPRVLIIGGGLGGLALAQGLRRAKIPFTVFERDSSPSFRPQGYRLRISPDGASALEDTCATTKLGLTRINAVEGTLAENNVGSAPARDALRRSMGKNDILKGPYTADRTVLRTLLMTGLEDNLSFGKQFERYDITANGITAFFEDKVHGVRSPVRKQYLPDQVLVDTEGRCIYGKTPLTQELADKLPSQTMTLISDASPLSLLLEPVRFAQDPAQYFHGRLESIKDYVYWVLLSRKATFGLDDKELFGYSGEDAKQLSLKLTSHWKPLYRSVLECQDTEQSSILRISSAIPTMKPWAPSAYVTLLGDAIHVMSPTAGAGANTALRDAAHLCRAIVGGASAETIGRYEAEMRSYGQVAIEGSYMGGKRMYNQPAFEECKPVDF
ncbi:hypothetical protein POJ06DRAFT_279747 [Lipomyces tetrasporus]|uniref:FAD-binding domain-containing protein n=1 Tax=Lipomyces tetrasporus TaxID=54092 RepID=A0AAD7VVH1_9ASCO|nr:uncharacterized protein POJ06DRAFT_279747 [Lipomyces tetrasporus]KAJ8104257.1 hypothetical protein POJ06DRAFT_279747 [Lipomyces tetrasporus]